MSTFEQSWLRREETLQFTVGHALHAARVCKGLTGAVATLVIGFYCGAGLPMTEDRVDRRLAAILAGDIAGYSHLMGIDEEGTMRQLKAHRKELEHIPAWLNRGDSQVSLDRRVWRH